MIETSGTDLPPVTDPTALDTPRVRDRGAAPALPGRDRSWERLLWYRCIQYIAATVLAGYGGWRATGRHHLPRQGGVLLVSNHLSYLDVFLLGIPLQRPLNYVARSTLFVPILGGFIRSLGGFPIQRDGLGASGLKETLRRLKHGGIVTLFPEGTRSPDGTIGEVKPGIAVLVARARVPVVPAGIAGTFQAWPRSWPMPRPHPLRIHYGPPILPADLNGMDVDQITALIASRMKESHAIALDALSRDMRGRTNAHPRAEEFHSRS
jgi:1-acyl-sn-glycerol-3-phosphate acyltransferase